MRFLLTLMVFAVLSGCAGEPKHSTWKNATGAEQNERLMWQSIQNKDWVNVEGHLSPTFVGVTGDGRMFDRAGWLQQWKSAEVREFSLGEVLIQPEGADMKVTYVFQFQAVGITPGNTSGQRVVSIWQQVKAGWVLTACSITPIQNN